MKSQHVFTDVNMAPLENYLNKHGLTFNLFYGIISFKDNNPSANNGSLPIAYENLVTSLYAYRGNRGMPEYDDAVTFLFNSSKSAIGTNLENIPDEHTVESWFKVLETAALIAAKCTQRNIIIVKTGRKDAAFIRSKGYEKSILHYAYQIPISQLQQSSHGQPI